MWASYTLWWSAFCHTTAIPRFPAHPDETLSMGRTPSDPYSSSMVLCLGLSCNCSTRGRLRTRNTKSQWPVMRTGWMLAWILAPSPTAFLISPASIYVYSYPCMLSCTFVGSSRCWGPSAWEDCSIFVETHILYIL